MGQTEGRTGLIMWPIKIVHRLWQAMRSMDVKSNVLTITPPSHRSHLHSWLILGSRGRGFDSRSGRSQVVSTWMSDCLRTGEPSRCITNYGGQLSLSSLAGM